MDLGWIRLQACRPHVVKIDLLAKDDFDVERD
jgi:hypothetical protein